jgi:hypothetical protein
VFPSIALRFSEGNPMQAIELKVGDRIPSANDLAYANYVAFCGRIPVRPAAYDEWLRFERLGKVTSTSLATGAGYQL